MTSVTLQNDQSSFPLPELLVMANCASLKAEFMGRLESRVPLLLDASSVREIDFAGVQLLISAQKSAERAGVAFSISGDAVDGLLSAAFKRAGVHDFSL